jgi:hypothetical protein
LQNEVIRRKTAEKGLVFSFLMNEMFRHCRWRGEQFLIATIETLLS